MPRRARKRPSRIPPRCPPYDEPAWGVRVHGMFIALAKRPLLEAGLGPPPFTLTLPDGRQYTIVLEETPDELAR